MAAHSDLQNKCAHGEFHAEGICNPLNRSLKGIACMPATVSHTPLCSHITVSSWDLASTPNYDRMEGESTGIDKLIPMGPAWSVKPPRGSGGILD